MTISVANTIDPRTSRDASKITSSAARRWSAGRAASSRRRRTTFSTSMIASSTSAPIAIVRPPSDIVLTVIPSASIAITATSSDSGSDASEISVGRSWNRNRNRITATRIAPSRSATDTLRTAVPMKSAWRALSRSMIIPSGRPRWIASSSRSMRAVSSRVLAPGCFWIPITTAGRASDEPVPRRIAGPSSTSATWPTTTGTPSRTVTTALAMSASPPSRPTPRISASWPPRTMNPPVELAFDAWSAASTSGRPTSNAASRSGATRTWYCRTSPPIGTTCATPGMASSRRRSVQSAASRTSIGVWRSLRTAMNRISPMIDEIGASVEAAMSGGSWAATSCSFSFTIWRAMYLSVPHANSTQTIEMPMPDAERTRRTPVAPLTDDSIGNVTSVSTSCGASPWASVTTVTVGAVRSGNTSTGMRSAVTAP